PFGAFIELAPGVDGLIHISELGAGRRLNHPSEVLSLGQAVEAPVLAVDLERRRISLTPDADKASSEIPDASRYAPPKGADAAAAQDATGGKTQERTMGSFGALLQESLNKRR
ncbi:MAG: S1 RNA-binding domain-containing protein, partial [Chromatiaceae bacterium]